MLEQDRDILSPLAQRRQLDDRDVEPVVEIGTKALLLDQFPEVLLRRRNHSTVDRYQLVRSQPLDFSFLQHTQQLDLERHRQALDFIQEHRSPIRPLDFSYPPLVCTGEGAKFMAEDLAFEQLLGETTAVDRHELSVAPTRMFMKAARDEFLAGAGLAVDYDVSRSVGKVKDRAADLLDHRGSAKQRGLDADPILQLVAERRHLEGQLALLGGAANDLHQKFGGKWFFDEVVGAGAHRLHGHRDIAVARHQDYRQFRLDFRCVT